LRLFVDNNLPPDLARGLNELFSGQHLVTCHRDKFGKTHVKDEEWIPALGTEGEWVVLSGDLNIPKKRPTRDLFLRSGLVGFFPRKAVMELPLHKKASRVLYVWQQIIELSEKVRPAVFELQIRGEKFSTL
jgi:hypothetical protein